MEFRNVLVYVDGRPACERAVRAAAAIARRSGGRMQLLHVAEPLPPVAELDPALQQALEAARLEEIDRLLALARSLDVEAGAEASVGRPFVEIIRAVLRTGADLVVKAAKGRDRLGWPLLGSTALHLVRKCPVPVWLVGPEGEPVPRRVLALMASDSAADGRRDFDRQVLGVACTLAGAVGAELHVGAAWEAPGEALLRRRMPEAKLVEYVEAARHRAEDALGRALAPFAGLVNPARVHLLQGVPWIELVALAGRRADLVVIGTAPPRAGAAFLIREEAEEIVHRVETSIVAVKPEGFVSPVKAA